MANIVNTKVGNQINNPAPLPDGTVTTQSFNTAVLAAGTTQAGATALVAERNVITNNTTANGVILPLGLRGQTVTVLPVLATNAPKVYPPLGGTVSGGALNANTTAPAQVKTTFWCLDDTGLNWF